MTWSLLLWKVSRLRPLLLLFFVACSSIPFLLSANYFEEYQISSAYFFEILQFSPGYSFGHLYENPWNSNYLYADNPTHYHFESRDLTTVAIFFIIVGIVFEIVKRPCKEL